MNCSPCTRTRKASLADRFCVECQEYFCAACVQQHGNFSILSQHSLLDLNGTQGNGGDSGLASSDTIPSEESDPPLSHLPTERCQKHSAKVIDMYCKTHDTVGCSVCFVPHYRRCDDIHYIPDVVQSLFNPEEYQRHVSELNSSKETLEKLIDTHIAAETQLKNMKAVCVEGVKSFRNELNEILDTKERNTLQEIEQKYDEINKKLDRNGHSINTTLAVIQHRLGELNVTDCNQSVLFVYQSMCKSLTASADELCRAVGKPLNKARLFFKGDLAIKSYLSRVSFLGSVREQKFTFGSIKEQTSHDITVDTDEDLCNIWGTCITGDGSILIADNSNNKLKLLDKRTYKVKSSCGLSASPRSLSRVSDTEAAVSLSNKVIRFVSTEGGLSLTRSLQMEHNCFGLELTQGHMFISDGSQNVLVYDTEGKLQRTIFQDNSGENIFSESRDIAVSDDGQKIHVADSRKGLITLDIEGNVIWRYTGSELKGAYGVCTDGEGHLLVTGILSHNVVLMSQNGEKFGAIIGESDGVKSPVSVCFDRTNSRALVTKNGNNLIAFEFY